jgi:hypothetical protein
MMADVAENDPDEPTPPRGIDRVADPDEYRRFLEFRRFQEYQRFVEGQQQGGGSNLPAPVQPAQPQPQPLPQPQQSPEQQHELAEHLAGMRQQLARIERVTNPPTWQKILRNKWLHRALWLVIVVAVASWGIPRLIHHYLGGDTDQPTNGAALRPGDLQGSGRLEMNPKDAVAAVYHIVAETPPDSACLEFSPAARVKFAADLHAPTCRQAVRTLHAGLGPAGVDAYSFVQVPDSAVTRSGGTARISSCAMGVDDGPRLGLFVVTENQFQEWQITGHSNEPDPCPAPSSASAPPT